MVEFLHPILPSEIGRVALSLLDLDNPFNSSLCQSQSLPILCIFRLLLRDAGLTIFRLTHAALRLTAAVCALLEVLEVALRTTVAPGAGRNEGCHFETIERDISKLIRSTFYLLDATFQSASSQPRHDKEVNRFLQVLGRYQELVGRTSGPEYAELVENSKIDALRQIQQECELLHDEALDLAGPEVASVLRARFALQAEGMQPSEEAAGVSGGVDEVENDLWHGYPEEDFGYEGLGDDDMEDALQDIWPDEKVAEHVEDEDEDEEGGNYDPEEEQMVSDDEEADIYNYEDDYEGWRGPGGPLAGRRSSGWTGCG